MDINELQAIESEENVTFVFKPKTKTIAVKGKPAAVDRGLDRIKGQRDEVATLLRERQGISADDEEVEREISLNVPSLAVQRPNYRRWYMAQAQIYQPSEAELELMFSRCDEGDEIIFDFAHSFTVRKPNGLLVSVDRKGRVGHPSPYSPAVRAQTQTREQER